MKFRHKRLHIIIDADLAEGDGRALTPDGVIAYTRGDYLVHNRFGPVPVDSARFADTYDPVT